MSDGIATSDIIDFYNKRLSYYARDLRGGNSRLNKVKKALSQFIRPNMFVLDIGCGVGITSKHMAQIGAQVIAVDIAPDLIEYAKKHSAHKNITYLVEDVTNLDLDQKFDAIIFVDVFEHIIRQDIYGTIWRLVRHNTHTQTLIYLNLPDANFRKFMQENYPDKGQIVDEAYTIDYITSLFEYWDFVPLGMSIYAIDTKVQYNEYLFATKVSLNNHYRERLKLIYKGEGK